MEILSFASLFGFTKEFFSASGNNLHILSHTSNTVIKNDSTSRKQYQNNLKFFDYLAPPTKVATGWLKRINHITVGR